MITSEFLLSLLGFIFLSLTLKRHRKEAWPALSRLSQKKIQLLKIAGFVCLLLATALSIDAYGWSRGLVWECVWLSLAGCFVSLLLSYQPRWTPTTTLVITVTLITSFWV